MIFNKTMRLSGSSPRRGSGDGWFDPIPQRVLPAAMLRPDGGYMQIIAILDFVSESDLFKNWEQKC